MLRLISQSVLRFSHHTPVIRPIPCVYTSTTISFCNMTRQGLVLGVYEATNDGEAGRLTPAAQKVNSDLGNKIVNILSQSTPKKLSLGKSRVLYGLHETYPAIAVVCVGTEGCGYDQAEGWDEEAHNIRVAAASGVRQLREVGETTVLVDPVTNPTAAAEGASLALFTPDSLKLVKSRQPSVDVACFTDHLSDSADVTKAWARGITLAKGQNFARHLMDTPANLMTPVIFCEEVKERVGELPIEVNARDLSWIEAEKMGSFLSVSRGSVQPPRFLELHYKGGSGAPLALVGKGITFDSGGISLKPAQDMDLMMGDMGGAACIVGAIIAAAELQLPINVSGFIALAENMPSGSATKPGDVVFARNGKSIQVMNTDAEGRLVLADALNYAETSCQPQAVISMATLTGAIIDGLGKVVTGTYSTSDAYWDTIRAIITGLGTVLTGTYSTSDAFWDTIRKAGEITGDRMWRMPLLKYYSKQMTECHLADVDNIGTAGRQGGSCTAAAFLREFVTHKTYMHLDIAGVMYHKAQTEYLGKGMTGRPTRTMVQFLEQLSKN